jgi:hypothetical protein
MTDYFGAMGSALYTVLAGGSALVSELGGSAIYSQQAPDGQAGKFCVFSHQGGGPENNPAGMRSNVWYVRAYADNEADARKIDGLIDAALTGVNFSVTGFTNFWTVREQDLSLVENLPNGKRKYSAGAFYRVRLGY